MLRKTMIALFTIASVGLLAPEVASARGGFGGMHAAPAVRGVYDVYYRKTRHEEPPGAQQIAKR